MTKDTISPELAVLERLRNIVLALEEAGKDLTATTLKRQLGLSDADFKTAADYGCASKVIKWNSHNYYSALKAYVVPEEAYYDWVKRAIEALWALEGYDPSAFHVENTSRKDSKIVGPWTRPDLTLLSHKKFSWTIGTEFDVVTFEVKRPDNANVLAVFEALSHAAAATRAYVVFPVAAETWRLENPAQERRVRDECVRHGVGLIFVTDVNGLPVAQHALKAARREIDHEKCNDFLEAVVTPLGKKRISEWKS